MPRGFREGRHNSQRDQTSTLGCHHMLKAYEMIVAGKYSNAQEIIDRYNIGCSDFLNANIIESLCDSKKPNNIQYLCKNLQLKKSDLTRLRLTKLFVAYVKYCSLNELTEFVLLFKITKDDIDISNILQKIGNVKYFDLFIDMFEITKDDITQDALLSVICLGDTSLLDKLIDLGISIEDIADPTPHVHDVSRRCPECYEIYTTETTECLICECPLAIEPLNKTTINNTLHWMFEHRRLSNRYINHFLMKFGITSEHINQCVLEKIVLPLLDTKDHNYGVVSTLCTKLHKNRFTQLSNYKDDAMEFIIKSLNQRNGLIVNDIIVKCFDIACDLAAVYHNISNSKCYPDNYSLPTDISFWFDEVSPDTSLVICSPNNIVYLSEKLRSFEKMWENHTRKVLDEWWDHDDDYDFSDNFPISMLDNFVDLIRRIMQDIFIPSANRIIRCYRNYIHNKYREEIKNEQKNLMNL